MAGAAMFLLTLIVTALGVLAATRRQLEGWPPAPMSFDAYLAELEQSVAQHPPFGEWLKKVATGEVTMPRVRGGTRPSLRQMSPSELREWYADEMRYAFFSEHFKNFHRAQARGMPMREVGRGDGHPYPPRYEPPNWACAAPGSSTSEEWYAKVLEHDSTGYEEWIG